jgi:CDP-diacylglycerol---serine O-phosphatidyltransferase
MIATSPLGAFHRANALTYVSLMTSIGAIAAAFRGSASAAGALVAVAVIADTFDGRFARLFQRSTGERALGVQLDSLSDAIAFGIAPCLCMALLAPVGPGWMEMAWWAAFFAFAASAITRLAFYNVTQEEAHGFIGLPVPLAALIWSSVLLVTPGLEIATLVMFATAVGMVAPVRVPRPTGYGLAAFMLWPAAVIVAHAVR